MNSGARIFENDADKKYFRTDLSLVSRLFLGNDQNLPGYGVGRIHFPAVKKSHDPGSNPTKKSNDPGLNLVEKSHDPGSNSIEKSHDPGQNLVQKRCDSGTILAEKVMTPGQI